ncbi:MAG: hypothetical protein HZB51_04280 [Chloroflexi bacterium]|nr:hypothetical protein [Chloroflexota bacterium]
MIKILTWNIHRSHRAWEYLLNKICPDIALLQEVPRNILESEAIIGKAIDPARPWGSAIWTNGFTVEEIPFGRDPGWVCAAHIKLTRATSLIAVSIHTKLIGDAKTGTQKNHVFPHLDYIIDDVSRMVAGSKFIVGGDLNSCRLIDKYNSPSAYPIPNRHGVFFDRIESNGYFNCHRKFHPNEEQTFFGSGQPYQDDHLFVSYNLTKHVKSCQVLTAPAKAKISEHAPLIAEVMVG